MAGSRHITNPQCIAGASESYSRLTAHTYCGEMPILGLNGLDAVIEDLFVIDAASSRNQLPFILKHSGQGLQA